MTGGEGRIVVHRDSGYVDLLRSYAINVDGKKVGAVRNGGGLEVLLPAGPHEVWATIDWVRSPRITVEIVEGGTSELWVGHGDPSSVFKMWGEGYLTLREVQDQER